MCRGLDRIKKAKIDVKRYAYIVLDFRWFLIHTTQQRMQEDRVL